MKSKRTCAFGGCPNYKEGEVSCCCLACVTSLTERFVIDAGYVIDGGYAESVDLVKLYAIPNPKALVQKMLLEVQEQHKNAIKERHAR